MPHLTTDDNVKLYYEDSGAGIPVVFVHEFAVVRGNRRFAILPAAIGASLTMRGVIRRRTCQRMTSVIRKIARATTFALCSMR
jgi:hypothetical protein